MIALALLQAAVAGPVLPTEKPRGTTPTCRERAARTAPGDILVCGRSQDDYRLRPMPDTYVADPAALPKAETSILGGKAKIAAEGEAGSVGTTPVNRAMVRLKVPF